MRYVPIARRGDRTAALLALLLIVVLVAPAGPLRAQSDLEAQRAALRPEFRNSLPLADYPHYRIIATVNLDAAILHGQEQVLFRNPAAEPIHDLVFRLLPNARSIYGGGSMTVERVTLDTTEVAWTLSADGTTMTVPLDPPLAPGEEVEANITFGARIPTRSTGYSIFHHSAAITSLSGWFPVLAPYEGGWQAPAIPGVGDANHFAASLYDVTLTAPSTHALASTGVTLSTQAEGDATVWRLTSGPARGFAIALSDRFRVLEAEREGVTIRYHALPGSQTARAPEVALEIAADALAAYSRRFGPYPYTEFDVVETPVSIGGYEFAGMVFVEHSLRTVGSLSQLRFIVAHETAHQWWFAQVGSDPVGEPWLDESLATYSTAVYLEETLGLDAAAGMIAYFRGEGGAPGSGGPITSSALQFGSWATYRRPVYYQGAQFLVALRSAMGDDAFFSLLGQYLSTYRFRIARTADFLDLAEQVAGRELDDLYLAWFGVAEPGA
ncbi:MAG: M1 family metallopeptidase [Chloroflexi bacterium]|nr:M1 family metallopeptidase [Chloroflexota bacterium]